MLWSEFIERPWVQVVMAYTVATAAMLGAFWACPNVAWMQWVLVAGVGFTLYGPQMLIGLCGAEVVPKASVSAANGMLGWISYLGALLHECPSHTSACAWAPNLSEVVPTAPCMGR